MNHLVENLNMFVNQENIIIFYDKIGIRYNYQKIKKIALIYEFSKYKFEYYRNDNIMQDYSFDEFINLI